MNKKSFPGGSRLSVQESRQVVALWKQHFPGVTVITSPEMGHPFLTIAHGFHGVDHMIVDGLRMTNPLFTNALGSFEVVQDEDGKYRYASAYEVMYPNIPSNDGTSSNMNTYANNLWKLGLKVHADHYHWKTAMLHPAIHHMGVDMSPVEFSRRTIAALERLVQNNNHQVLSTANARGNISIARSNGIVNANGNGNGAGINVGSILNSYR